LDFSISDVCSSAPAAIFWADSETDLDALFISSILAVSSSDADDNLPAVLARLSIICFRPWRIFSNALMSLSSASPSLVSITSSCVKSPLAAASTTGSKALTTPSTYSFSLLISFSFSLISVMSWNTSIAPITFPSESYSGTAVKR